MELFGGWLWLPGALLAVLALGLVGRSFRRLSAGPAADLDQAAPPDHLAQAARLDTLEKRLDDEVRARMMLEERLVQLHEELKIIRDRLARRVRRPEE